MFFWCDNCQQHVDEDFDGCVDIGDAWYCEKCYRQIAANKAEELVK